MDYAHEYATAIMHRGRIPMEPADFVPDWADRPRKEKYYPGAESFPLHDAPYPADATVTAGLLADDMPDAGRFSLPLLSGMLLDSYGLTGRRLGVQANTDLGALPHYTQANWSRGTASGGGLYPVSIYWISGPSGPLTPGVHYYSPPRHAMQRLLAGDVSGEVAAALGAYGAATDQFLVLGVKYWQNAFKYNSFSFHAVSMDVGALLQTWRVWARARGLRVAPRCGSTKRDWPGCWGWARRRKGCSQSFRCCGTVPRRRARRRGRRARPSVGVTRSGPGPSSTSRPCAGSTAPPPSTPPSGPGRRRSAPARRPRRSRPPTRSPFRPPSSRTSASVRPCAPGAAASAASTQRSR